MKNNNNNNNIEFGNNELSDLDNGWMAGVEGLIGEIETIDTKENDEMNDTTAATAIETGLTIEERRNKDGELFAIRLTPPNANGEVKKFWTDGQFDRRAAVARTYIAIAMNNIFDNPVGEPEKGLFIYKNANLAEGAIGYAYRYSGDDTKIPFTENPVRLTSQWGYFTASEILSGEGKLVDEHAKNSFFKVMAAVDYYDGVTYDLNVPVFHRAYFERLLAIRDIEPTNRDKYLSDVINNRLDQKKAYRAAKSLVADIAEKTDGEVSEIENEIGKEIRGERVFFADDPNNDSILLSKVEAGTYQFKRDGSLAAMNVTIERNKTQKRVLVTMLTKKGYKIVRW